MSTKVKIVCMKSVTRSFKSSRWRSSQDKDNRLQKRARGKRGLGNRKQKDGKLAVSHPWDKTWYQEECFGK